MAKLSRLAFLLASIAISYGLQVQLPSINKQRRHDVSGQPIRAHNLQRQSTYLQMSSTKDDKKKKNKGSFDEGLRTKLVSESIAPWRNLRLFFYGALGSGAAVGGFITLAGVAAALSGARTDLDLNTEVRDEEISLLLIA